ncbi:17450_t:CDS:2 [Gigaspora margarita]|uniref:17450_t:CDS:1 n=1 Tax=Gigaspora margarita TaxID=4874 RepID=A0ABN7V951_GIGMA|nr:17450_t:CDS:2 [Gigaspora margarita]
MQPNLYHIFWDLEYLTEKLTSEENAQLIYSSFNYKITSYNLYKGPNALEKFIDKLEEELTEIQADLSSFAEIIIEKCYICEKLFIEPVPEILQQFEEANHQLLKYYPKKKDVQKKYQQALNNLNYKVKDYDHINKKFRDPAHDACNKKLQIEVVVRFTSDKLKYIPKNIKLWILGSSDF